MTQNFDFPLIKKDSCSEEIYDLKIKFQAFSSLFIE